MKICLVNNLYPPYAEGGTEVVVRQTMDLLHQHGYQVVLITTRPTRSASQPWVVEKTERATVYRFRPHNLYYFTEGAEKPVWTRLLWHALDVVNPVDARTIRRILQREKPDLVHGHNLKGMSYTLPGVCARLKIPYVHTLHNYQLLHPFGTFMYDQPPPYFSPRILAWLYQAINKHQFASTRLVLSPTKYPLTMHVQVGFFKNAKKMILPSGVVMSKSVESSVPAANRLRLVYVGALEKIKGIRQLIESVHRLPEQTLALDIYGSGSLQAEIEKKISGIDNIRLRGYLRDKRDLRLYDALVFPSVCYETQGLVVLEALSHSLPVIASDVGGATEFVKPGVNGVLFRAGSVDNLAQTILSLAVDRKKLSTMKHQARPSVEQYSMEKYAPPLLAAYQRMISE